MVTLTTLASFNGMDGQDPSASLIVDAAGDLFGTTAGDETDNDGTVFEIVNTASGYASTPTVLASFNGANGANPFTSLIFDTAGDLFGTSSNTAFEIVKTATGYAGTPTTLVSFYSNSIVFGPTSAVIADAAGNLFGTTEGSPNSGMSSSFGTIFEIVKTANGYANTPTILVNFNGTDGRTPEAGLIADAAGNLFGTTYNGGAIGFGTVFELVKTNGIYASTPTTLVSFNITDGEHPAIGLIADAAGDLFGTTSGGGAHGFGTVFEIVKSNGAYASTPTTLVDFNSNLFTDPSALIADAAGNLFGTTEAGTVFEIVKTASGYASTPTTLYSISGSSGAGFFSSLVSDASGNLFGAASGGGTDFHGTVFEISGTGFQTPGPVVSNTTGNQETLVAPVPYSTVEGSGYDVLDLSQNPIATASSAYTLNANGNGTLNLTTTGSIDHVSGVLQVAFSDKTMTVTPTNSFSEFIALLYQGALDRTPETTGLAGWIQRYAAAPASTQAIPGVYGLSDGSGGYNGSLSIAGGFTNSTEFIAKYGSLTNQQFVTALYSNVLDRAPDQAGMNDWLSQLSAGTSREHVLVGIADSQEAITDATVGFTGQSGYHAAWLFLV